MKILRVINMGAGFTCTGCRSEFQYPPIRMPATRLEPAKDRHGGPKPGLMDYGLVSFCIDCVERELSALRAKIECGEMFPLHVWGGPNATIPARYETEAGVKDAKEVFPDAFQQSEGGRDA